jgi:hypothetical protein
MVVTVSATAGGDFVDLQGIKPARMKCVDQHSAFIDRLTPLAHSKHGLPEDRDPFKTREKGRDVYCFHCGKTAAQSRNARILGCDFCEQHWHLDCLDPPLTALPPTSHRWQCPLHADRVVVRRLASALSHYETNVCAQAKRRQPKNQVVLTQTERNMPNNGLIDVLPSKGKGKKEVAPDYDETVVNGVRYQVPEETIILDFWDKIHGVRSTSCVPSRPFDWESRLNHGTAVFVSPRAAACSRTSRAT